MALRYLLDTDHISLLQRESRPRTDRLKSHLANAGSDDVGVCLISLHEQFLGVHALINQAKNTTALLRGYEMLAIVYASYQHMPVISFDQSAASRLEELRARGIRIGAMDLRIAAIALSRNLILVSSNATDFQKVSGLIIEDWTT